MNKLLLRFEWYRMKHLDSYIPEKYKKAYENMQRGIPFSFEEAHKVCEIVENVKRGGNMNKELEEVKRRLELDIKSPLACGDVTVVIIDDLETVLQALDNSISKEAIEEKKETLKKEMIEKGKLGWFDATLEGKVHVLQELLEGK